MLFAAVVFSLAGCGGPGSPAGAPPTGTVETGTLEPDASVSTPAAATPPPVEVASVWQLRYRLLDHYPSFAYCDPDFYPVVRRDEQVGADEWWASTDHGSPEASTILQHLGYREPLTESQRLAAYRDHKRLTVIAMTAVSNGYRYELSISAAGAGEPDATVIGTITVDGSIQETGRDRRIGGCPICLEAGTRIATPHGDVAIALIEPGDLVWTTGPTGDRIAARVERVVRRPTPGPHLMLELVLADGRRLVAAGAHPGADGTYLRQLRAGQLYDGATIVSAAWIVSTAPATFDILPAGTTGAYWANDILVGSTLTN